MLQIHSNAACALDIAIKIKSLVEMAASNLAKALFWGFFLERCLLFVDSAIGVNWGTLSSHKLPPSVVVDLMRENKIGKVKLFDADPEVLWALRGSGIEVMVGIPNDLLAALASSIAASDQWVGQNVSRYMVKGGVDIRYVVVDRRTTV